jgi:hypothetical protein
MPSKYTPPSDDGEEFEEPGTGTPAGEEKPTGGDGGFDAPQAGDVRGASEETVAAASTAEIHADLVALKAEIEKKLAGDAGAATVAQEISGGNIVGVGFAHPEPDASGLATGSFGPPGTVGLAVFTIERSEMSAVVSEIGAVAGTRALSTVPIVQVPVGVVDAYSHRFRARPAPGGVSVGHHAITAGTLGCLSVGLTAPRDRRLMVLSNNHVLANSNDAAPGDCICQPGPYDGGMCPADQIAILEQFVSIDFSGGVNYVDCATAWAWPDRVRRELVYLSGGVPAYFRVGSTPIAAALGMLVGKTGRTTQLRMGRVFALGVSVNVNYGGGRVAHFQDQIAVVGTNGDFSAGGDSGSLVWEWATGLAPVGLLYAGGGGTTFANPIARVLADLDIRLYT